MISGLKASGMATAIRTAGQARVTMDTMARQIATGQRVSSVKDDGAAWARANFARSEATASQALSDSLGVLRVGLGAAIAFQEMHSNSLLELRGMALTATDPSLAAATRSNLQADFAARRVAFFSELALGNSAAGSVELRNSAGGTWVPFSSAPGAGDLTWTRATDGTTTQRALVALGGIILPSINTSANAQTTLASIQGFKDQMLQQVAAISGTDAMIDADQARLTAASDRLSTLAGRLTDADLGKASAARAQAEARQQLALSTVRQAISAYGNFTGGLLGNVQRTQRGIMA